MMKRIDVKRLIVVFTISFFIYHKTAGFKIYIIYQCLCGDINAK
jgi:hypothetical protein